MSIREELADYAHQAWSGWMQYLFTKGRHRSDGSFVVNRESVERWKRQMMTPYADLPEHEKESDRAEADRMLEIVAKSGVGGSVEVRDGKGRSLSDSDAHR